MEKRGVRILFASGQHLDAEATEEALTLLDGKDGLNRFMAALVDSNITLLAIDKSRIEAVVLLDKGLEGKEHDHHSLPHSALSDLE